MSDTIKIKSAKVLTGLMTVAFHPNMIHLANWIAVRLSEVVFTSAYRKDDLGIAGMVPCRHLDIRSWIYEKGWEVADDINAHWTYDPDRPQYKCALYHAKCPKCGQDHRYVFTKLCEACGKDITYHYHIHCQVHDNTKYLGG